MHGVGGAEALYKRALASDPRDVGTLYNYALLLQAARKDHAAAGRFLSRSPALNSLSSLPLSSLPLSSLPSSAYLAYLTPSLSFLTLILSRAPFRAA